ncbi:MAG: hypothetical protein H0U65_01610 [Rubrobacter sp.]|jgi:hypothetical protein|nr:hypothetical protein [Rubrobacter sp.]
MKSLRGCLAISLFIVLAALSACSPDEAAQPSEPPPPEDTVAPPEGTFALSTTPETTGDPVGEGTLGPAPMEAPEVVLRLEGDEGVRFSGICDAEGGESVLSGEVPKRFTFADLGGSELSCRIQKQDERNGNLRVILLSGDTTRSVQQTNAPGGTIEVSFSN